MPSDTTQEKCCVLPMFPYPYASGGCTIWKGVRQNCMQCLNNIQINGAKIPNQCQRIVFALCSCLALPESQLIEQTHLYIYGFFYI